MAFSFDGFDFMNDPYGVEDHSAYSPAQRGHSYATLGTRPGGVLEMAPPGVRELGFSIGVAGDTIAEMEQNKDALFQVFRRPRRRLVAGFADGRYVLASMVGSPKAQRQQGFYLVAEVSFTAEDPYFKAATPSADIRTPTLALLPGETSGYGLDYSLTPGGSAPAPIRWLFVNQAGGVTPSAWQVQNRDTLTTIGVTSSVPAGSALLLSPRRGAFYGVLAAVVGFWPLGDASGTVMDFSGNSRGLTANGSPSYLQDGPEGGYRGGPDAFDTAAGFDGVDDFFSSSSTAFQLTAAVSLVGWVNIDAITGTHLFLGKGGSNQGYAIGYTSAGFMFRYGTGSAVTRQGGPAPLTGQWYFVAGTHSQINNRSRLYIGTLETPPRLEAAGTAAAITNATNDLRLGSAHDPSGGTARFHDGRVAMPAVYSAELTEAQIRQVWERGPQAYADAAARIMPGTMPELDPAAATNTVRVRLDAASAPSIRVMSSWRSRYE